MTVSLRRVTRRAERRVERPAAAGTQAARGLHRRALKAQGGPPYPGVDEYSGGGAKRLHFTLATPPMHGLQKSEFMTKKQTMYVFLNTA